MMDRDRIRRIITLALPIIGGMVSQNILNLIDTAMVGHLGDDALAAVGFGGFATFMATAFITGLSSGVQAIAARRMGAEQFDVMAVALNGGLMLAFAMAIPLTGLLYFVIPEILPSLLEDQAVVVLAIPYLQVRMLGIAATGANFCFRGYWNGVNLSKVYMRTLIVMHISNVILNYILIFGKLGFPELGATGAAIGTTISLYVGTIYYFVQGFFLARERGFLAGIPDRDTILTMLRLSIPAGVMNFFFAFGMTTFFWIIGKIGTSELAAANVLINLLLIAILPGIGFGLASASLVGQALGHERPDEAKQWGWDVVRVAVVLIMLLSIPAIVLPDLFLELFLHNDETLALARPVLRLFGCTIWFDVIGVVLMNSLLGAGASRTVMTVSIITQWCINLPLAYLIGPILGHGLFAIFLVQVGYRSLQTIIFIFIWQRGDWAEIKV